MDVDGAPGEAKLAAKIATRGQLPPTSQVKTGRGRHLYFALPPGVSARSKAADCLDVRCDRGYVVAPPSLHVSGERYKWTCSNPPATVPDWLLEYAQSTSASSPPQSRRRRRLIDDINVEHPPPWSEAEQTRIQSALAYIPAGSSYDDWLHVGMALHWLRWGERGLQIFDEWSRNAPEKYLEWQPRKKWESFDRPYDGKPITIGTLFHMAKQHGWNDPTHAREFNTDMGNARRLVARHGSDIRFVPEWHKWIKWDSTHWSIDEDGAIMRFAKETVEALLDEAVKLDDEDKRTELVKHALRCQAASRLEAMVSLATTEAEVVLSARQLDADPWLLGVQNRVVDLRTGQFRAARREDYITKRAGIAFNQAAECPNWRAFLHTITAGDAELAAYLQRAVGYALTGLTCEEVLFVLWGTGNNGKSTWRETLHALFGDYAIASDAGLLIERKTPGGATPELARLKGRRFVAINETSENDRLNEARVKFITSHDKITARNLYQEFFDFDPTHKTFLTTNHKPIIRGTDTGIWRRIHLLPFTVTIPTERVEKDFRERRLLPELAGILNWALEGLRAYLREGLNPPPAVQGATDDYQRDMDVVGQWIEDRCVLDPQATVPTGIVYDDYVRWAQTQIGWTLNNLKFRRNLTDRGFGAAKGTGGQRLVRGLRLQPPGPPHVASVARPYHGEWR
jgi:putative DNA primase/helicase